jgi:hypothetical protein
MKFSRLKAEINIVKIIKKENDFRRITLKICGFI